MRHRHKPQVIFALMAAATIAQPVRGAAGDPAADYPNRPIRFILANGPGSNADIFTRILAQKLGEVLGQQVVVDSRPGAGGRTRAVNRVPACGM
jgi:tripartite-type tricarboxylate transporter receptor subunit TctC